jgi:hypothetical protein
MSLKGLGKIHEYAILSISVERVLTDAPESAQIKNDLGYRYKVDKAGIYRAKQHLNGMHQITFESRKETDKCTTIRKTTQSVTNHSMCFVDDIFGYK